MIRNSLAEVSQKIVRVAEVATSSSLGSSVSQFPDYLQVLSVKDEIFNRDFQFHLITIQFCNSTYMIRDSLPVSSN